MSLIEWASRLLRRTRLDDEDFAEEIRSHVAMAADEKRADGADPESARLASLKEFGNVTLTTEAARRVWTPWWLEALHDHWTDVRYAIRTLAKNPAFSATVVCVLTIGVGLNAAVFTMLKSIAFSPIAGVDHAARMAVIFGETSSGRPVSISYPDYRSLRDETGAFAGLFGTAVGKLALGRGRGARQVWGELVSGNYFDALGVRAEQGRTLLPSDEAAPGASGVVVISDGLWRRDFGSAPDIVGRTIELNNYPLTIVGVADASFHGTTVVYDVEIFVPITVAPQLGFRFGSRETTPAGILGDRSAAVFYAQGYLRNGTPLASAAAQADAQWATLARERPLTDPVRRLRVVPFWQSPGGAPVILLPTLGLLTAMGLLVLLIACANIAGLIVVRGLSQRGEIAVRLALGATRARVVRLLLVENIVLAVPGAVLGVLLARWSIPLLVEYADQLAAPDRLFFNIGVDGLVIAFAVTVACGCVVAFGFVPAVQTSRVDLVTVINEDASPRGASRGRLRAGLVTAQLAVSVLLLVGAGLATRSVDAARRADPGFDASHLSAIAVDVRQNGYDEVHGRAFYRHLLEAARGDTGIVSATLAEKLPLAFLDAPARRVEIDGHASARTEDLAFMWNTIGSDYFRTLRIGLLAGRDFEDRDDEHNRAVAIVNNTFAQRFWGNAANAIGKRIRVLQTGNAEGDTGWRTIVGVAADIKYSRINESSRPYFYLPFGQSYRANMVLQTRGAAPVGQLVDQARAHVAALDRDLPILYAKPIADMTRGALMLFNLTATMLLIFGGCGMALAGLGIYGLVSFVVRQSTHEIGIRMALGASARSVVVAFITRGVRLGVVGAAIGVVAALASARLLQNALFGVSATDPLSYARALAIVLGGVLLATLIPAWRAARTNPLAALRHQ